jgi:hypothetical protein
MWGFGDATSASKVEVAITVRDKKGGQPVPCRIHLKDSSGKPQRAGGLPFWFDHFVSPGKAQVQLNPGKYSIEIERGLEYGRIAEAFEVNAERDLQLDYRTERLVDLTTEGWWSGELHVHRPVETIELLMQAEDLHLAPVITWWNKINLWDKKQRPGDPLVRFDGNRFYQMMAGEDEREGGALLFFHLMKPLAIGSNDREYPSLMKFVQDAQRIDDKVWIDIEKPFWWDVPLWLATGKMQSIGLANNHMCRDRVYESEAWGKPRSVDRMPPLGQRPLDAGNLLSHSECGPSCAAIGWKRIRRAPQSGRLQPRLCSSGQGADLRRLVERPEKRVLVRHQRPTLAGDS